MAWGCQQLGNGSIVSGLVAATPYPHRCLRFLIIISAHTTAPFDPAEREPTASHLPFAFAIEMTV